MIVKKRGVKKAFWVQSAWYGLYLLQYFIYPAWLQRLIAIYNRDSYTDWADLAVLAEQWLVDDYSAIDWCDGTDFNHSSKVDLLNFALLAQKGDNTYSCCFADSENILYEAISNIKLKTFDVWKQLTEIYWTNYINTAYSKIQRAGYFPYSIQSNFTILIFPKYLLLILHFTLDA